MLDFDRDIFTVKCMQANWWVEEKAFYFLDSFRCSLIIHALFLSLFQFYTDHKKGNVFIF